MTGNVKRECCPVCEGSVTTVDGQLMEHNWGVGVGDRNYPVSCLASGLYRGEAQNLEDRLRRAAHP